ncbi:MAG TPA: TonB-dependent receptor [Candidatus Kapabacteria bacterium]|nr:TonB-dependent receptor [Candidatus Kapabacteria bacterium]
MKNIIFFMFFSSLCLLHSEEMDIRVSYLGNNELKDQISYKYGEKKGKIDNNSNIKIDLNKDLILYLFNPQIGNYSFSYNELLSNQSIKLYDKEYSFGPISVIGVKDAGINSNSTTLNLNDRLQYDGGMFLDNLLGFSSVKKSPIYGVDPVLRGFKNEQLSILLNGCESSIAACPNRMDPPTSHIPMHQIEKVEVIKGPYGLRYSNSFAGTVNFIPIDEFAMDIDKNIRGTLRSNYESNGSLLKNNADITYGNENMFLGLTGSFYEGANYKDGNDSTINSKFRKNGFGMNAGLKFGQNTVRMKSSYSLGTDVDFPTLMMDMRKDETISLNLEHQYNTLSDNFESITTNIYVTKVDHVMNNYLRPSVMMMKMESPVLTLNYGARSEANIQLNKNNLYIGADWKYETADGTRTREMKNMIMQDNIFNNSYISKSAVFSQYNYNESKYTVTGAVRIEYNQAKAKDMDKNFIKINPLEAEDQLNLSISIGSHYYISDNISVGLWAGRSQRSGSLVERYINSFSIGLDAYEVVGNPSLKQEVNNQMDLQFSYNTNILNIKVNAFTNILNNYISSTIDTNLKAVSASSPGVRRVSNLGDAYKYGIEMSLTSNVVYDIISNMNISYTYAELKSGEAMPEVMPLELDLNFVRKFLDNKLAVGINFQYAASQNRVSTSFGEKTTPEYYVLNSNISYQFFKNLSLELGINNILDKAYYEHLSRTLSGTNRRLYSPGRSIWGSLLVNL